MGEVCTTCCHLTLLILSIWATSAESCTAESLLAQGFEWRGSKFYRPFSGAGDAKNQAKARESCRGLGADLPMVRTADDLAAMTHYFGSLGEHWVGLVNPTGDVCGTDDSPSCRGIFQWINGDDVTAQEAARMELVGNYADPCVRMRTAAGKMDDNGCDNDFKYVCQFSACEICTSQPPDPGNKGKSSKDTDTASMNDFYQGFETA